jgi:hypothetical protein
MKVFSPTLEEFEKQCNELMDTLLGDPATIEERVSAMSITEYAQLRKGSFQYLRTGNAVLNSLATFLRDGYKPWAVGATIENDPLRTDTNRKVYTDYNKVTNGVYTTRFENLLVVRAKDKEYRVHEAAIALEKSLTIKVDDVSYKAEKIIDVLWAGWECDSKAWLVKCGDTYKVVATNHGTYFFADQEFLLERIAEYEKALRSTKEFLVQIR